MNSQRKNVNLLIGLSGSVATIKYLELLTFFLKNETFSFTIKLISSQNASFFLQEDHKKTQKISLFDQEIPIFYDKDEWNWKEKGDKILHIELRKWADVFLIAPLSANSLAKISCGISDNLLTCVARAWDYKPKEEGDKFMMDSFEYSPLEKPFIVAPAMNTCMYEHPFTEKQLNKLKKLNIIVLKTVKKILACGDEGFGAMESPFEIYSTILTILQ